jgi:hypothetical protein
LPPNADTGGEQCIHAGEPCDPNAPNCCTGSYCAAVLTGGTYCVPIVL